MTVLVKANNKYMKDYNKNKEKSYLEFWDKNNLNGWAISQKLPLGSFEWVEETYQFNADFIKTYDEGNNIGYFLEVNVQYPEELHELHNDLLVK